MTSAKTFAVKDRRILCIELRKSGMTLDQIGREVGISPQAVHTHLKNGLARLDKIAEKSAEELRRIELERLDTMHLALYAKAITGDVVAVRAMLKIGERRAALLGLDAPRKLDANLGTEGKVTIYLPDNGRGDGGNGSAKE